MAVKKGTLSIDSENIFPIIKKWVYSDHDIFVRELVSNGCDAITKLKKLAPLVKRINELEPATHALSDGELRAKTDEFKAEFDEVINALRSDKYGLLKSRSDMSAYARQYADSTFKGSYCTEYGFRVDTEKHAYLLRCNPTRGDYNFYCYCFVKEWLDKHIQKAEQGIRFIDPNYKELFRIPDGGRIIVTNSWGEKREYSCRFIDECHTEVGNNIFHICEFAERMQQNGATYEPKQAEQLPQKASRKNDYER